MTEVPKIGHEHGQINPEVLERTRQAILDRYQDLQEKIIEHKNVAANQALQDGVRAIGKQYDLEGKPKPPAFEAIIHGSQYRIDPEAGELDVRIIDNIATLITKIEAEYFSDDSAERS